MGGDAGDQVLGVDSDTDLDRGASDVGDLGVAD